MHLRGPTPLWVVHKEHRQQWPLAVHSSGRDRQLLMVFFFPFGGGGADVFESLWRGRVEEGKGNTETFSGMPSGMLSGMSFFFEDSSPLFPHPRQMLISNVDILDVNSSKLTPSLSTVLCLPQSAIKLNLLFSGGLLIKLISLLVDPIGEELSWFAFRP